MLRLVQFTLIVIALALAAGVLGLLAGPFSLLVALLVTALAMLVPSAGERRPAHPWLLILGILAALAGLALLGLRPDESVHRLLAFSVILGGCAIVFRGAGIPRRTLYASAFVALAAGLFFLVLLYSPHAWLAWTRASLAVSALVGAAIGRPLALGPSYSGFNVTVLILFSLLAIRMFTVPASRLRTIVAPAWVFAMLGLYLVAMAFVPGFGPRPDGTKPPEFLSRHVPWNLPALLFLVQIPALWIAGRGLQLRPVNVPPRGRRDLAWAAALGGAALLAVAALVVRPVERASSLLHAAGPSPRVVLYEKGFVNWQSPTFQSYGEYSSGMFGRLPVFLRQLGFDAVVSPALDDNALAGARVAVIVNPLDRIETDVRDRLFAFVRAGGSLLVVGEHTWVNDRREEPLNDLLAPSEIRVNFDSAYYRIGGWFESCGYSPDPIYAGLRQDRNEAGVGIGASLDAGWNAVPLLWGPHSFSDAGSRTFRQQYGHMGDSTYAPGEQLGDVILAAEQRIGRGRVVVLGDTTPLFNLLMVGSQESLARLFAKLAAPPAPRRDILRLVVALVLFALAGVALFLYRRRSVVPVIVIGVAVSLLLFWRQSVEAAANRPALSGNVAVVDGSHANAFSSETWRADSLAGLFLNLMRSNVQPVLTSRWSPEHLEGARLLFIISPLREYSPGQTQDIVRFINSGGTVVVSVDPATAPAVAGLLDRFGLRVRNKPLGPFITMSATGGQVRFRIGHIVESLDGKTDGVLAAYEDLKNAVIIERRPTALGAAARGGRLLLIGDGQFFYNKNVETDKGPPIMENVNFIRWLALRATTATPEGTP